MQTDLPLIARPLIAGCQPVPISRVNPISYLTGYPKRDGDRNCYDQQQRKDIRLVAVTLQDGQYSYVRSYARTQTHLAIVSTIRLLPIPDGQALPGEIQGAAGGGVGKGNL